MSNILSYLDQFSQTPSLNIKGNKRVITKFGSCVSVLTLAILIAGSGFLLHDYFEGLSYRIDSYIDNSATPNIDLKKMKLGFLMMDYLGNGYPDMDRIFSFKADYWEMQFPERAPPKAIFKPIPMIKCNSFKNNKTPLEQILLTLAPLLLPVSV